MTAGRNRRARGPTVQAHDLFCLYPTPTGHVAALRGLSLEVAAGERVVVHGPNGSGKTTLLRVLSGEQPPSAGSRVVAGVDLAGADGRGADRPALRGCSAWSTSSTARTLRPELDVLGNVALQLRLAGAAGPRADRPGAGRARRPGPRGPRRPRAARRCPAGRRSGWRCARPSRTARSCCSPTSRPASWTATSAEAVYALLAARRRGRGGVAGAGDARRAAPLPVADRVVRIRDGRLSEEWEPAPRRRRPGRDARRRRPRLGTPARAAAPGRARGRGRTGASWTPRRIVLTGTRGGPAGGSRCRGHVGGRRTPAAGPTGRRRRPDVSAAPGSRACLQGVRVRARRSRRPRRRRPRRASPAGHASCRGRRGRGRRRCCACSPGSSARTPAR